MSVILTEENNVMVNSKGLIGTTEQLTKETKCLIKQCRCFRVREYIRLRLSIYWVNWRYSRQRIQKLTCWIFSFI